MKKTYVAPEVEVSVVSVQDILNASIEVNDPDAHINAESIFNL